MPFRIEPAGPERLQASGELDFGTAAAALEAGLALLATGPRWTVDLSRITTGDSAGLAVLVEWLSVTAARQGSLSFESVPQQMLAIARISELEELLLPQPGPPGGATPGSVASGNVSSGAAGSSSGSSISSSGSSSGSSISSSGTLPS